jgi:hypothetical protein
MKTNIFYAVLMLALIIFSCSDDDDNSPALSGKWHLQTIEYFECPTSTDNRVLECGATGNYATCHDYTFSGGFYTIKYLSTSIEGEGQYTLTGNKIKIPNGVASFEEYEFTLSGTKLVLINLRTSSASCREKYTYVKM